ncbi:tyrosine-type recombinase/integrase [uncultured Bradyrhizobium sp.]|uniref:tyrosine-type recombinase/integrase n=1 Tax=uncultured Bradyrhizobium sp. TaxID=199684 RepID=UPI0035CA2015
MSGRTAQFTSLYTSAGQRKYLTPAERAQFIAAARVCPRAELRTFCLTLASTGCRISEALDVRGRSVEAGAGFIALRSLKRRNGAVVIREVPVPADLLNELEAVHGISALADRCLWTWSRSRAWQLVKSVMAEAQIGPGIHATPKGLRHGFGIHAIRSGVPINLVQRWLGHSRMETTAIYLQALGDEEREIAARMW